MTSWNYNNFVQDYLMANDMLNSAAIISHEGVIWAQSETFPTFQEGEISSIMQMFQYPASRWSFIVGGQTRYNIARQIGGSLIRSRLQASSTAGITIMKTRTALVIGIYDRSPDDCHTIVESLGTYFTDNNL